MGCIVFTYMALPRLGDNNVIMSVSLLACLSVHLSIFVSFHLSLTLTERAPLSQCSWMRWMWKYRGESVQSPSCPTSHRHSQATHLTSTSGWGDQWACSVRNYPGAAQQVQSYENHAATSSPADGTWASEVIHQKVRFCGLRVATDKTHLQHFRSTWLGLCDENLWP